VLHLKAGNISGASARGRLISLTTIDKRVKSALEYTSYFPSLTSVSLQCNDLQCPLG
jgi:hypothetical protein